MIKYIFVVISMTKYCETVVNSGQIHICGYKHDKNTVKRWSTVIKYIFVVISMTKYCESPLLTTVSQYFVMLITTNMYLTTVDHSFTVFCHAYNHKYVFRWSTVGKYIFVVISMTKYCETVVNSGQIHICGYKHDKIL